MSDEIIRAAAILDKAEVPFCLMASTLLGIYRDGEPLGPTYEFAVLAKDMTQRKLNRLDKLWPVNTKRRSELGLAIFDLEKLGPNESNFEIHLVYFKGKYAFHNLAGHDVLVWPKETWLKENWEKIKWHKRWWNTPMNTEPYLAMYYGLDWRTPQSFSWGGARNHFELEDIKEKRITFDELTAYCKR